ncbi:hypothetical protein RB195_001905 [Necator americanus]|uniref:Uncharacterized protein n=1 Tax=Necator americanus TaxID=51031 RepID=A0ABR1DGG7_NECAM
MLFPSLPMPFERNAYDDCSSATKPRTAYGMRTVSPLHLPARGLETVEERRQFLRVQDKYYKDYLKQTSQEKKWRAKKQERGVTS